MSMQEAPVKDPATTDHHDDDDALVHKFCPCQSPLPQEEKTTYCGHRSNKGWTFFKAGTAPAPRLCVVCNELEHQACRFCGKTTR